MSRVQRKTTVPLSELIRDYLKAARLTTPLNTQRIFAAWDAASGAGSYTVRRFFRDGRLYITVNSSVVRSQLSFQRDALLQRINTLLEQDDLFTRDDARAGFVRELILK